MKKKKKIEDLLNELKKNNSSEVNKEVLAKSNISYYLIQKYMKEMAKLTMTCLNVQNSVKDTEDYNQMETLASMVTFIFTEGYLKAIESMNGGDNDA